MPSDCPLRRGALTLGRLALLLRLLRLQSLKSSVANIVEFPLLASVEEDEDEDEDDDTDEDEDDSSTIRRTIVEVETSAAAVSSSASFGSFGCLHLFAASYCRFAIFLLFFEIS